MLNGIFGASFTSTLVQRKGSFFEDGFFRLSKELD